MAWDFDDKRPVYIQISEMIKDMIFKGQYTAGDRLPSVRELSVEAAVNPNTMQRALAELENQGLAETRRTAGRTVTENLELIQNTRRKLAFGRIDAFLASMRALGYTDEQTRSLIAQWEKEDKS